MGVEMLFQRKLNNPKQLFSAPRESTDIRITATHSKINEIYD